MNFKKLVLVFGLLSVMEISSFGQAFVTRQLTSSFAVGKRQQAIALGWNRLRSIGKHGRFQIGYGVRFTSYFGQEKAFVTAPARLTSRQTGPQVIFSKTYLESLDTLTFSNAQVNFLNASIHLGYKISNRLQAEFNIDALGMSFGAAKTGALQSSLRSENVSVNQSAKPTPFNLLLVSDNDIGSLNSELVMIYRLNEKSWLRGGFCFLFAEYTSKERLIFDNDRFRNKASMAVVGLSYTLNTKSK